MTINATELRKQFPALAAQPRLAYLDSAASAQTPQTVIDAMDRYYGSFRANVHRGMYRMSEQATEAYEATRGKIAALIGGQAGQVVLTHGTTESLNLAATALGRTLKKEDEVLLTAMEHHANLVPWQQAARRHGFTLRFIPLGDDFRLNMEAARGLITERTKVLSVTHVSNVLGTVNDVRALADAAHAVGATVVVDGAQSVGHIPVDVAALGADLLAFSGHKMFGPTGIGVLWGKRELLERLEPMLFGGDMILEVTRDGASWNEVPWKFEAGTPAIAPGIGLGAAVDWVRSLGVENIAAHERELATYAISRLNDAGVRLYGPSGKDARTGVLSFTVGDVHAHDVVSILDTAGVAVRGGHHCAMPLMRDLGVTGTVRASLAPYARTEDIDALIGGIEKVRATFRI